MENRTRIIVEILHAIRDAAPKLHIGIKMNSNDMTTDGIFEDEALQIGVLLDAAGIDSIEVSGNGTSVRGITAHEDEAYFAPFATLLARTVDTPVMLVGGLRSVETMEEILQNSQIQMLSLSRPLLREPDLPMKMQRGTATEAKCISCNACYSSRFHHCVFRAGDMRKEKAS